MSEALGRMQLRVPRDLSVFPQPSPSLRSARSHWSFHHLPPCRLAERLPIPTCAFFSPAPRVTLDPRTLFQRPLDHFVINGSSCDGGTGLALHPPGLCWSGKFPLPARWFTDLGALRHSGRSRVTAGNVSGLLPDRGRACEPAWILSSEPSLPIAEEATRHRAQSPQRLCRDACLTFGDAHDRGRRPLTPRYFVPISIKISVSIFSRARCHPPLRLLQILSLCGCC